MKQKGWVITGIVVLIAAAGIVGWQSLAKQAGAQPPAQAMGSAVVQQGDITIIVEATGNLSPRSEVSLAFASGGRVLEVLAEEGQAVEAGQALARLETDELALQVKQAEAALATAQSQLAQLQAPPRPEDVAIKQANLRATQAQVSATLANRAQVASGADSAQIAAAQAQLAAAEAQRKVALDAHDKTMECRTVTKPNGEKEEVCPSLGPREEQARYNLQAAEVALAAAQAQVDKLLAGADPELVRTAQANVASASAQSDVAQAQLDLLQAGPTKEQIQVTQSTVEQARLALEQAQLRLDKATLNAPAGAIVSDLRVQPGEWASPGEVVIRLVLSAPDQPSVRFYVAESDMAQVKPGNRVQVTFDGYPGQGFEGQVSDLEPTMTVIDGSPTLIAWASLEPDQAAPSFIGMTANVVVIAGEAHDVPLVPAAALRELAPGSFSVFVVQGDGQLKLTPVKVGLQDLANAEITEGLAVGDVVSTGNVTTQ
jgi:multidrug efflux pump subunit AcrA (membrane-fusion protein)